MTTPAHDRIGAHYDALNARSEQLQDQTNEALMYGMITSADSLIANLLNLIAVALTTQATEIHDLTETLRQR